MGQVELGLLDEQLLEDDDRNMCDQTPVISVSEVSDWNMIKLYIETKDGSCSVNVKYRNRIY